MGNTWSKEYQKCCCIEVLSPNTITQGKANCYIVQTRNGGEH